MLRDAATGFLTKTMPVSAFRKMRDRNDPLAYDKAAFDETAALGWMGLVLPEAVGGADFGYRAAGVIAEEIGRNLSALPFHSTAVLAATVLRSIGGDVLTNWGQGLASGETLVALAIDETNKHRPNQITTTAVANGDGFILTGRKVFVVDGVGADHLIATAMLDGELALFWVDPSADTTTLHPQIMLDARNAASVSFDGQSLPAAALLAKGDLAQTALDAALRAGRTVVAAEQLGIARACAQQTNEYLRTRKQFGTLIGNFQALQHRASDLYCEIEQTASLIAAALNAIDANAENAEALTRAAKAKAAKTGRLATEEAVQMHGGIGMTDEMDLGLYMKRDRALAEFLGDRACHIEWLLRNKGV